MTAFVADVDFYGWSRGFLALVAEIRAELQFVFCTLGALSTALQAGCVVARA